MKYLSRALIAFYSIIMSLCVMSCENLMFIDAAQLYRVSFETNGGTEIEAYRTDIIAKVPDCKKEDAEFLGWYTSSDFSSDKITFPYELKEDTTLYAKWVQKYQVLFETNGGSEIAGYKTSVVKDAPITLKNENIFIGWYTTPDFSGEAASFPYTLTEPTVFYAKWAQIFTVQFETNGGSSLADIRGSSILETPISTKTGYILKGWYSDEDLLNPVTFPLILSGNCTLYAKWEASSDITYTVEHYKQSEDFTTYNLAASEALQGATDSLTQAKSKNYSGYHYKNFEQKKVAADGSTVIRIYYDIDSFMVIFNSNDGTNNTYNQVFFYNQSQKLITNRFTRSGYTFEGWTTEINGDVKYNDSESVKFTLQNNTSKHLYAVWSYGETITDDTIQNLDLSNLDDSYTVKVTGEINQYSLMRLAEKIEKANNNITLDLSRTTGLDIICGTKENTSVFKNCKNLTSVVLPEGLVTIGAYTFAYCGALKAISFPKSLKTIGNNAFYYTGLEKLLLSNVEVIGKSAFEKCSSLSKINMSGVKTISSNAFSSCSSLVDVVIDAQIIDYRAFEACNNLTSVTLSKSVKRIDGYAFQKCNNLSYVIFLDKKNWYSTSNSSSPVDVSDSAVNARNLILCLGGSSWYKK
ncbi:Listeria/Bacterioides repeat-containing protein [Treponema bryantii]|uniref:Listeria/Bacterioides repeat-containing protein n=1 Tax=Treponema bryantii TaxID=163 RepID=A0A1I3LTY4_9SPIR|nr:InlB B-repeat-containing protein [Treponema bryantii]SFI88199.1 Listeria/Bacterioides repeat-containing protein [Treponema bryantii]